MGCGRINTLFLEVVSNKISISPRIAEDHDQIGLLILEEVHKEREFEVLRDVIKTLLEL